MKRTVPPDPDRVVIDEGLGEPVPGLPLSLASGIQVLSACFRSHFDPNCPAPEGFTCELDIDLSKAPVACSIRAIPIAPSTE